ncbi:hypothetical protein CsSME_00042001 [Camellia sinensis var. sinensis]
MAAGMDNWGFSSGNWHLKLGMEEVSSSSQSVELLEHNEGNIENESEKTSNVKEKVEDPKVGMLFDSIDELVEFYKLYGKAKGFGVSIRTSKKGTDGKVRHVTKAKDQIKQPL